MLHGGRGLHERLQKLEGRVGRYTSEQWAEALRLLEAGRRLPNGTSVDLREDAQRWHTAFQELEASVPRPRGGGGGEEA